VCPPELFKLMAYVFSEIVVSKYPEGITVKPRLDVFMGTI